MQSLSFGVSFGFGFRLVLVFLLVLVFVWFWCFFWFWFCFFAKVLFLQSLSFGLRCLASWVFGCVTGGFAFFWHFEESFFNCQSSGGFVSCASSSCHIYSKISPKAPSKSGL